MTDDVKARLFIATPMYGGMCTGGYTVGLLNTVQVFMQHRVLMYYAHMQNESLITRARNRLAYDFLNTPDATHLMFIDADISFSPEDIVKMIDADKDIICGLYPKKEINWSAVVKAVQNGIPTEELYNHTGAFVVNAVNTDTQIKGTVGEPMEIGNGGTGFMLIKRGVFESLKDKVPTYTNDMHFAVETNPEKKVIHEFFTTSIDEESNRLLSEDFHFCKLARQNGYKVYAAPWATLVHSGTYNFAGQLERT